MDYKELEKLKKVTQASFQKAARSEVFKIFKLQIFILIVIDRLINLITWIVSLFN